MTAAAPATSACGVDAGRLAARRWKLGHQLFHLELASMTTLIDRSAGELARRDEAAAARSLALLADLYEGSTATMRYASDFPSVCYERVVRPSMSPPLVSPGFSGLLNREHAVMMSGLSALLKALGAACRAGAGERLVVSAAKLREAIARNRRAHGRVCERHVPGGVSLLKGFYQSTGAREPAAAVRRRSAGSSPGHPESRKGGDR